MLGFQIAVLEVLRRQTTQKRGGRHRISIGSDLDLVLGEGMLNARRRESEVKRQNSSRFHVHTVDLLDARDRSQHYTARFQNAVERPDGGVKVVGRPGGPACTEYSQRYRREFARPGPGLPRWLRAGYLP